MARSMSNIDLTRDGLMKVERLHAKLVPNAQSLAEAVQASVGKEHPFTIEIRRSVYTIKCSREIDMKSIIDSISKGQRARSSSDTGQPGRARTHRSTSQGSQLEVDDGGKTLENDMDKR